MEKKLTEEQTALMRIVSAENRRAQMGQYADWAIKGDLMLERRKAFLEAAEMARAEARDYYDPDNAMAHLANRLFAKAAEALPGVPLPAKD